MSRVNLLLSLALLVVFNRAYGCCEANTLEITGAGTVQV